MTLDLDDMYNRYTWQQGDTCQVAWSQIWAIPYCASPAITPFDESPMEHHMPLAPRIAAALALVECNWKALGDAACVDKFGRFIFEYILEDVFDKWEPMILWWEDSGSSKATWNHRPTEAPDNPPQELTHMQDMPQERGGTGFGTYTTSIRICKKCGIQICYLTQSEVYHVDVKNTDSMSQDTGWKGGENHLNKLSAWEMPCSLDKWKTHQKSRWLGGEKRTV